MKKHKFKRLFLVASYDVNHIISDELLYYLNTLSLLGDIVFFMDNEVSEEEYNKLKKLNNLLFARCERHGEYDFGSYKRAFMWVDSNNLLKNYDWVYFVNDSVYLLHSPELILNDLENRNVDMVGMYSYKNKIIPEHIQSWFFGVNNKIANSELFKGLMANIQKQENKDDIIYKYEVGISRKIIKEGYTYGTWLKGKNTDDMRVRPLVAINHGVPFLKKAAVRHIENIRLLLPHVDNYDLVEKLKNIPKKLKKSILKVSFLGVPLFSIKNRKRDYFLYLFDFLPVIKVKI